LLLDITPVNKSIPYINNNSFLSHRGKGASHIMAFDNGQVVYCYGYEGNIQRLIDKCIRNYLKHHAISNYVIHTNPFK